MVIIPANSSRLSTRSYIFFPRWMHASVPWPLDIRINSTSISRVNEARVRMIPVTLDDFELCNWSWDEPVVENLVEDMDANYYRVSQSTRNQCPWPMGSGFFPLDFVSAFFHVSENKSTVLCVFFFWRSLHRWAYFASRPTQTRTCVHVLDWQSLFYQQ